MNERELNNLYHTRDFPPGETWYNKKFRDEVCAVGLIAFISSFFEKEWTVCRLWKPLVIFRHGAKNVSFI